MAHVDVMDFDAVSRGFLFQCLYYCLYCMHVHMYDACLVLILHECTCSLDGGGSFYSVFAFFMFKWIALICL